MTLNEQIEQDYVHAYKLKDALKLNVLRLVKTAAKNRLVEEKRPHDKLSDDEMLEVLMRQTKQRQDSIEQYRAANRSDLAEKEQAELLILQEYLPSPLTDGELDAIIEEAITVTGANGPKAMGKVISHVMGAYRGRVDGKSLSTKVREKLGAKNG